MNLLLCFTAVSFVTAAIAQHNQDTLKFSQVIFRHGERNTDKLYGKYAENPLEIFPEGLEILTNVGKRQAFDLGVFLRERYSSILGESYNPSEISIVSAELDRTIQCAELALQGLYRKYNERASWGADAGIPPYEPIPVKQIPGEMDNLLALRRYCPRRRQKLEEGRGWVDDTFHKENPDLYEYILRESGELALWAEQTTSLDRYNVFDPIHAVVESLYLQNKPLEEWMIPVAHDDRFLEYDHFKKRTEYARDLESQRLNAGPLVQLLVETFEKSLRGEVDNKVILYSAHDKTILNVLWSVGIDEVLNKRSPTFSTALLLELHQIPGVPDPVVEFWYRNGTTHEFARFPSPDCRDPCTLDKLVSTTSKLFNVDYNTECNLQ